jgi:hypothetical protein
MSQNRLRKEIHAVIDLWFIAQPMPGKVDRNHPTTLREVNQSMQTMWPSTKVSRITTLPEFLKTAFEFLRQ